jgi:hypothetical protein
LAIGKSESEKKIKNLASFAIFGYLLGEHRIESDGFSKRNSISLEIWQLKKLKQH